MLPSITFLIAINSDLEDKAYAKQHLIEEARKVPFLSPELVVVDSISSYQHYNYFCIRELTNHFNTDFVLVFQMDTTILNPSAWSDEFFKYDYIGAPWTNAAWAKNQTKYANKDLLVGNGGFSLRSKKLCNFLKNEHRYKITNGKIRNEDTFISIEIRDKLEQNGFVFAPYEIAKQFSVENDFYEEQFGCHERYYRIHVIQ